MPLLPLRLSRRQFLFGGVFAGLGYMRFIESQWLSVGRHQVRLPGTEARPPLTLLQLSDFHASSIVKLDYINRAVTRALAACRPDLICLTGDYITSKWQDWAGYTKILQRLTQVAPTFGIFGNHDGGLWSIGTGFGYEDHTLVEKLLTDAGVQILHNDRIVFEARDWRLNLVGLGDDWAEEMSPYDAFPGLDVSLPTVLLSHNPDTKDALRAYHWDLMLSGHTHGGQLSLPGLGTPFAPVHDKNYVAGLKPWRDRWIHITKGIGNIHGMRFNCRPEVSVLTLV